MSETCRILTCGYHLKVYLCKESRYCDDGQWSEEQQIEFVNLPFDFKIEQVNSRTGVYNPTKQGREWIQSFFQPHVDKRDDYYYEERYWIESIFIDKISDWHNELREFVDKQL